MMLAQRLPVRPAPEQFLITLMRDDMINHGCRCHDAIGLASATQWIEFQKRLACRAPLRCVATIIGRPTALIITLAMLTLMGCAVSFPRITEPTTPGQGTRRSWQVRHDTSQKTAAASQPPSTSPASSWIVRHGDNRRQVIWCAKSGGNVQDNQQASSTAGPSRNTQKRKTPAAGERQADFDN